MIIVAWLLSLRKFKMADKMGSFVPRVVQRKDCENNTKMSLKRKPITATNQEKSKVLIVDLRGKSNSLEAIPSAPTEQCLKNESTENIQDDDEEVISYSKYQRWPEDDEPVCVVCGRYGAYICNETENDVCSLECKARHLKTSGFPLKMPACLTNQAQNKTRNVCLVSTPLNTESADNKDSTGSANSSFQSDEHFYAYKEHPTISELTQTQVEQLQKRLEIQTKGKNVSNPILEFFHCQFDEQLSKNITECAYYSPTPIQMQLIPVALSGRDVMACAQTGSGKTAAFLLPMIARIYNIPGIGPHSNEITSVCK
jgi:ATP-dependent RNA helicase DDX59